MPGGNGVMKRRITRRRVRDYDDEAYAAPTLPKIDAPVGACAMMMQAHAVQTVTPPRFVGHAERSGAQRVGALMPTAHASEATRMLYNAFLTAHTVVVPRDALDVVRIERAEARELMDAHYRTETVDGSLQARPLSIVLLAIGPISSSETTRAMLDAFAHFRSTLPTATCRVAFFADADAESYLAQISGSIVVADTALARETDSDSADTAATELVAQSGLHVLVRWCELSPGQWDPSLTARMASLSVCSQTACADAALRQLRQTLFKMTVDNVSMPLESKLVASGEASGQRSCEVPQQAWANSVKTTSAAFFDFATGKDAITVPDDQPVPPPTNIRIRLVNRSLGPDGLTNETCFHGMLLGSIDHVRDKSFLAAIHANQLDKEDVENDAEHAERLFHAFDAAYGALGADAKKRMNFYTCAVQTTGHQLLSHVSLYGSAGAIGESIQSPGSWIWRHNPAIVGVDHVLRAFAIVPCSENSTRPAQRALLTYARLHLELASNLYARACERADTAPRQQVAKRPRDPPAADPDEDASDADGFLAAAMGLGLSLGSRRLTVGDAFHRVQTLKESARLRQSLGGATQAALANTMHGATGELTEFLSQAVASYGTETTFSNTLSRATVAMRHAMTDAQAEAFKEREERCVRVARRALALCDAPSAPAAARASTSTIDAFEVLGLLGRSCKVDASLQRDELVTAILDTIDEHAGGLRDRAHVQRLALRMISEHESIATNLPAIVQSIVFVAVDGPELDSVFLVDANAKSLRRLRHGTSWVESTPGQLLDTSLHAPVLVTRDNRVEIW